MDRAEAPDERRMYRDLSWIFPIISPPEDYAPESAEFAAEILAHAQGEVKTLLDLGCGAGHYDFNLKPHFAITGIDISEAMLALARRHNRRDQLAARLSQLSPLRILDRGYAIVTTPAGAILKESAEAPAGSAVLIRLARGRLHADVTQSLPPEEK